MSKNKKKYQQAIQLTRQGVRDLNLVGPHKPNKPRDPRIVAVTLNGQTHGTGAIRYRHGLSDVPSKGFPC